MSFAFVPLALLIFFLYGIFLLLTKPDFTKDLFGSEYPPRIKPTLVWIVALMILGVNIFLYDLAGSSLASLGIASANTIALVAYWLGLSRRKRSEAWLIILIGVSLASGWMLLFRANGFVQGINIMVMGIIWILLIAHSVFDALVWEGLWLTKQLARLPGKFLGHLPQVLGNVKSQQKSILSQVIKILTITFVLILFFGQLLLAADPVFREFAQEISDQVLGRILVSIFIAIIATITATLRLKSDPLAKHQIKWVGERDLFIPGAILSLLFALFLLIQAKYLFASEAVFKELGITYSEYVRKGFTELLTVSFFGGLLAYLMILKNRMAKNASKGMMFVTTVLLIELGLMLLSAFKRDLLYVNAYGLTRVRVIGIVFLVWLGVFLFSMLLFNLRTKLQEVKILRVILIGSVLAWASLNIMNIDRIVAKGAPGHHQYTDYFYLNNLSEDAYESWLASVPELEKSVDRLTNKTTLTEKEMSELAGVKLALISLKEKRIELLKKFSELDWQMANYNELYDPYCTTCIDGEYPVYKQNMIENDDQRMRADLDEEVIEERHRQIESNIVDWRSTNFPMLLAYSTFQENESLFERINSRIDQIRIYQLANQINLAEQERLLLYEFSYPFISISLDYRVDELHRSFDPQEKHDDPIVNEFYDKVIRTNPRSVFPNEQTTLYGYARLTTEFPELNVQALFRPVVNLGSVSELPRENSSALWLRIDDVKIINELNSKSDRIIQATLEADPLSPSVYKLIKGRVILVF